MPLNYDGQCGYNDGEELVLSSQFSRLQTTVDPELNEEPVINVVQSASGMMPDMNDSNADNEDLDDEVEIEIENMDVEGEGEDFDEADHLFREENIFLNARLEEIHPVYNTLPVNYSCDADSFPCPGIDTLPKPFDAERDELRLGLLFPDKAALQMAVKEWSIRHNRQFKVRKGGTDTKKWEVYCAFRDELHCPWRLRGSVQKRRSNFWEIVKLTPNHECLYSTQHRDHPNLNSCLITQKIVHLVAVDPSIRISMIVAEVEKEYRITIAYNKAWYAKQRAVAAVFGDWKESYAKAPQLLLAIRQSNPGTVVSMFKNEPDPVTNESQLLRLFWAFGPSLAGFTHCRPVMSIDATHLYGKYKGKLLIAMGVDGNGQIFPVAFAVVREETKADWGWFLRKLRAAIGPRQNLCLISDRHASIVAAVNDEENGWAPPIAVHRFCLRHIRSNFMTKFRNVTLKKMVWRIGSEVEQRKFEHGMEELKRLDRTAWQWCNRIDKQQWSLAHDGGFRYGCTTTNLVECFNGVLIGGRNLPLCAMIMLIYHRCAQYFIDKTNNWNRMVHVNLHGLTDRGASLCEESREHARHLRTGMIYDRRRGTANVTSTLHNDMKVILSENFCECGSWLQFKVPCGHAIKVCMSLHVDHLIYVHDMYRIEPKYRLTYETMFAPLRNRDYWPPYNGPITIPPLGTLRGIGRPQSSRFRNEMDERTAVQQKLCSKCRQPGHTIRTCTA